MPQDTGSIVLVEDNEADIEVARRAIERIGGAHPLWVFEDGISAADALLVTPGQSPCPRPKVMLIDINLPGLDGIELLTRIRSSSHLRHTAVVMISSSTEDRDIRKAYERGCNSYVTKPVDIRALQALYTSVASYWTQTNISNPASAE